MKPEELKNIYANPTEDFHHAVLSSLYKLDRQSTARFQKRRRTVCAAVVCGAVIALGGVTAVAASTNLFGLLSEPVGKYGLRVKVESDVTETAAALKPVKLKFGYMTEGFVTTSNAESRYHLEGVEDGPWFSFDIVPAADFDYTETYIIDSQEMTANGHKLIITTRQMEENGDVDYGATMYFEDWGYVVGAGAYGGATKDELIKIMQHLDLEYGADYVPEIDPADRNPSELDKQRRNYDMNIAAHFKMYHVGDAFDWGQYADENGTADDYIVKITSVTEQSNNLSLPDEYFNWTTDYSVIYADYFDENGSLITPYTRVDGTLGDGVNVQRKTWETKDDRHFYVVTVDVTCNKSSDDVIDFDVFSALSPVVLIKDSSGEYHFNDEEDEYGLAQTVLYGDASVVCSTPGDNSNSMRINRGETRTITYGVVVDGDVLDNTYLRFGSQNEIDEVDDTSQTITINFYNSCVKLKS